MLINHKRPTIHVHACEAYFNALTGHVVFSLLHCAGLKGSATAHGKMEMDVSAAEIDNHIPDSERDIAIRRDAGTVPTIFVVRGERDANRHNR